MLVNKDMIFSNAVAICILVEDNLTATKHCIENALKKCEGIDFKLFVYDIGSNNQRVVDYFVDNLVEESHLKIHTIYSKKNTLCKAYNILFKDAIKHGFEYICTFQPDVIVSNNWLNDLVYNIRNISVKSGIVGIKNNISNLKLQSVLSNNDVHENIWVDELETISGVCLFKSELIKDIGGYNEELNIIGFEQNDLCLRASLTGAINYYITGQESAKTGLITENVSPRKNRADWVKYKEYVESVAKKHNTETI